MLCGRFISCLVAGLASLVLAGTTQADLTSESEGQVTGRGISAEPISTANPSYPSSAASKGIEGWVLLSFVVQIDGTTSEVTVLDSSHAGVFEKAAIRAIEKWTYKPARVDGKPVPQSNTHILMTFQLEDWSKGASRTFARKFRIAQSAISNGDTKKAENIIAELKEEGTTSQYENAYLEILQANYFQKLGDNRQAIYHLRRATIVEGEHIERRTRRRLLRSLFTLQAIEQMHVPALKTYEVIKKKSYLKASDPIHDTASKIMAFLEAGNAIASFGRLSDYCSKCEETVPQWRHTLYHQNFYVDQIEGTISHFKLFCGFHWAEVKFDPSLTWSIKDNWGKCHVYVYGSDKAKFRMVEFPNK